MTKDNTNPDGKWQFDAEVTDAFADMLKRSIPGYEYMRQLTFDLAQRFVSPGHTIVDLGCSRGEALAPFVDKFTAANRYIGVEVSPPMLEASKQRFKSWIDLDYLQVLDLDLRESYPKGIPHCVTLSILTLQFTPIEYRLQILRRVYDELIVGGAFFLVEKVMGDDAVLDKVMVDAYLDMKREHGYSQDQIERKRLSLEGVLVPVTADMNVEFLRRSGFSSVDCYWRSLNFAGWVAVK